jgi:hypothetical protein
VSATPHCPTATGKSTDENNRFGVAPNDQDESSGRSFQTARRSGSDCNEYDLAASAAHDLPSERSS